MDAKYRPLCAARCESYTELETPDLSEMAAGNCPPVWRTGKLHSAISARTALLVLSHMVLILTSTMFVILSVQISKKEKFSCSKAAPSIMGEGWSTHTYPRRFNGTFKLPSTYKGPPNEAVDEAWEKITPLNLIRITETEFQSINVSKYSAEIPDKEGGRIAIFESFPMIHCLKSLWQNTYPEYYSDMYDYNQAHKEEWHEHVDHCVDMIRQKLMCDADATLITYNWLKNHYYPHPNFNVEHQCRDYDGLLEVSRNRKIDQTFFEN